MNCNESLFDVITSIEAYPFSGDSLMETMDTLTKIITEDQLGIDTNTKISVPMKSKTCKREEKVTDELQGIGYEVTVSWQVQNVTKEVHQVLTLLGNQSNHLILRTYGGGKFFIRCEEEGYLFHYVMSDGLANLELVIHNRSGIQQIM